MVKIIRHHQEIKSSISCIIISYKTLTVAEAQSHDLSVKSCGMRSNSLIATVAISQSNLDVKTAFSETQMASST